MGLPFAASIRTQNLSPDEFADRVEGRQMTRGGSRRSLCTGASSKFGYVSKWKNFRKKTLVNRGPYP
jgi:hypothetical protein